MGKKICDVFKWGPVASDEGSYVLKAQCPSGPFYISECYF